MSSGGWLSFDERDPVTRGTRKNSEEVGMTTAARVMLMVCATVFCAVAYAQAAEKSEQQLTGAPASRDASNGKSAKERLQEARETFRAESEARLKEIDRKLREARSEAREKQAEISRKMHDDLQTLKEKQAQARLKLRQAGKATGRAWEKLKKDVSDLIEDLEQAVRSPDPEKKD